MRLFGKQFPSRRRLTKSGGKCRNLTPKIRAASIGGNSSGLGHVQPHGCLAIVRRGERRSPCIASTSGLVTIHLPPAGQPSGQRHLSHQNPHGTESLNTIYPKDRVCKTWGVVAF